MSIEIRTLSLVVIKSIYLRKTTLISSRSKLLVKIHYLIVLNNCDFLFEFEEISYLIVYAYFIDINIKVVILRNNFDQSI